MVELCPIGARGTDNHSGQTPFGLKRGEASDRAIASAGFGLAAAVLSPAAQLMKGSRLGEMSIPLLRGLRFYKLVGYAGTGAAVIAGVLGGLDYIFAAGDNTATTGLYIAKLVYGSILIGTSLVFALVTVGFITLFVTFIVLVLIGLILDLLSDDDIQIFLRKSLIYGNQGSLNSYGNLREQNKAFKELTEGAA